jgi:hypothetical protein
MNDTALIHPALVRSAAPSTPDGRSQDVGSGNFRGNAGFYLDPPILRHSVARHSPAK